MKTYIIRRILLGIVVLILVSIIIFFAMRLLPGDPILMLMTRSDQATFTQADIDALRHEHGLDKPLIVQYVAWVEDLLHGDMGDSIIKDTPVAVEIKRRVPITLQLGMLSFFLGIAIGIPAGIICAIRRGSPIDTLVTTLSNIGITVPSFWLGLMLVYVFSLNLGWLPTQGYTPPTENFGQYLKQLVMPVICLGLFPIASTTRQTRSSMLEILRQDYIRTAWAKGLKENIIIIRHALKNSLIPVVTLSGVGLSAIIGGTVIIETVFNIPGMGRLAVTAILNQDYPYVQGVVLVTGTLIMLINLLVDITYGWFDPRIRYN
jgi:peptide/nickel transport system permease protein